MAKRVLLVCTCVLFATRAWAGAIVTWEAFGALTTAEYGRHELTGRVPDPNTPYHLVMSFDLDSMRPTDGAPAGSSCNSVSPLSGTLTMGSYDYAIHGGFGFTHAMLPGSNCSPGYPETQFVMFLTQPADSPWRMQQALMELWYVDLLDRDGFHQTANTGGLGGFQVRDQIDSFLLMTHGLDLQPALQDGDPIDPAPVPEPATLTLLGLGLAAAFRRKRLSR